MILSWLLYLSGITGLSVFQIYLGLKIFKLTKSIVGTAGIILIGLFLIYHFSDGSLLLSNPQAWLSQSPLTHVWSQIEAIWDKNLPWVLDQLSLLWKTLTT